MCNNIPQDKIIISKRKEVRFSNNSLFRVKAPINPKINDLSELFIKINKKKVPSQWTVIEHSKGYAKLNLIYIYWGSKWV